MRLGAGPVPEEVTYEVWREFTGREGQDFKVAGNMSARGSLNYLRECRRDVEGLTSFRFYRVRATTVRQRVEEP